jgi:hypothetical protein
MLSVRSRLRRGTWVVLVAMTLGVLGPALTHARATPPDPPALSEVCSANGFAPEAGLAAVPDDDGRSMHVLCLDGCLCHVQCLPAQGPPQAWRWAVAPNATDMFRAGRDSAPVRAGPARCQAQPRAPPQPD